MSTKCHATDEIEICWALDRIMSQSNVQMVAHLRSSVNYDHVPYQKGH